MVARRRDLIFEAAPDYYPLPIQRGQNETVDDNDKDERTVRITQIQSSRESLTVKIRLREKKVELMIRRVISTARGDY